MKNKLLILFTLISTLLSAQTKTIRYKSDNIPIVDIQKLESQGWNIKYYTFDGIYGNLLVTYEKVEIVTETVTVNIKDINKTIKDYKNKGYNYKDSIIDNGASTIILIFEKVK